MELIVKSKDNASLIVTVLENFNLYDPADRKEILKRIINAMAKLETAQDKPAVKKRHRRTRVELEAAKAAEAQPKDEVKDGPIS